LDSAASIGGSAITRIGRLAVPGFRLADRGGLLLAWESSG